MHNFPELIRGLEQKYGLQFNESKLEFSGNLFVEDNDCYHVSINITPFPNSFPIVKELGGRIPFDIDRHKYSNATCCLTTKAKEQVLLKTKIKSLDDFIQSIVIPFFQNNSFFEINKKYIYGDYSHGALGVLESYLEIANISDINLLFKTLHNRVL